jgi:hypothetical protein
MEKIFVFYSIAFVFIVYYFHSFLPERMLNQIVPLINHLEFQQQEMAKDFNNMQQEMAKVNNMQQEMAKDFNNMQQEMAKVNNMQQEMAKDFNNMKQNISLLLKYASDTLPSVASSSSIAEIITVYPNFSSQHGCGNLLQISGKLYIATVAHLLADLQKRCRFSFVKVFHFASNMTFLPNLDDALLHKDGLDIALIPLNTTTLDPNIQELLKNSAAEIPNTDPKLGEKISGICSPEKKFVYTYGTIVEIHDKGKIESDTSGAFGWSGCGYFNYEGEFKAIHIGMDYFKHSSKSNSMVGNSTMNKLSPNEFNQEVEQYFKIFPVLKYMKELIENLKGASNSEINQDLKNYLNNLIDAYKNISKAASNRRTKLISTREFLSCSEKISESYKKCQ